MLRSRTVKSLTGSASLTSTSFRRAVAGLPFFAHPGLQNYLVTYTSRLASTASYNAANIAANMERRLYKQKLDQPPHMKRARETDPIDAVGGTPEQVLDIEAETLLARLQPEKDDAEVENGSSHEYRPMSAGRSPKPEPQIELELEIQELSSTGDGLAYSPDKAQHLIYVVPFAVPGDKVLAKTFPQRPDKHAWTKVDFVKLLSPSPKREGTTPQCPYFGTCSGCQLQMLPYEAQLAHKKSIVEKAFKHFSNLDPSLIPPVDDTIESPISYGYRTKITPHYDGRRLDWKQGAPPPPFGFGEKHRTRVVDIEQCPIATDILNEGLKIERKKVADTFWQKKTGSTVLLRENTTRKLLTPPPTTTKPEKSSPGEKSPTTNGSYTTQNLSSIPLEYSGPPESKSLTFPSRKVPQIEYTYPFFRDTKSYTSDHKAFTTEHIGPYTFTTRANSFFQNNNAILPTFLSYIREHILPQNRKPAISGDHEAGSLTYVPKIKYLLDAYCGSGLFSIALASEFSSVLGIDIDALSIECARKNADINAAQASSTTEKKNNMGFIAADAQAIFHDVPFPSDQTLCVIDPPRKGASKDFLQQLCKFGPMRVVYVSCNVHTQARDVGMLVQGFEGTREKSWRYEIERLGGFDFFPQTGHVEGVCFLNRVDD